MAGTIPLSMTQQFDIFGKPLAGAQLFIIQAGTVSTPQDAFQDTALTIKMPYPMTLDAAGRVPPFFLADGTVKIRLQDKTGVVQLAADSVLVIGPSAGGGGGGSVDPTQLIQTGNMIHRYGVGVLSGYVRMNGLTIGSAVSSATERANADCQALFLYLWNTDPHLDVPGGRGASALADWTNTKQLVLPDFRGYAPAGLCDMGNSLSTVLTSAFWGGLPNVLGSAGGGENLQLTAAQIPTINSSVSVGVNVSGSISGQTNQNVVIGGSGIAANAGGGFSSAIVGVSGSFNGSGSGSGSATSNNTGGQPHRTIGPTKLVTFYLKL